MGASATVSVGVIPCGRSVYEKPGKHHQRPCSPVSDMSIMPNPLMSCKRRALALCRARALALQ
jgi:hypothetical protein